MNAAVQPVQFRKIYAAGAQVEEIFQDLGTIFGLFDTDGLEGTARMQGVLEARPEAVYHIYQLPPQARNILRQGGGFRRRHGGLRKLERRGGQSQSPALWGMLSRRRKPSAAVMSISSNNPEPAGFSGVAASGRLRFAVFRHAD